MATLKRTWRRLGALGLTVLLVIATGVLFFTRRAWARYSLLAIVLLLAGYRAVVPLFSATTFDPLSRGTTRNFTAGLDCHIAYSVRKVERTKTIGDTSASG